MGTSKSRIDELLVSLNLAESLKHAGALILSGEVVFDDQRVDSPAFMCGGDHLEDRIRLKGQKKYVSRGGEKIASIVAELDIGSQFEGKTLLDIGSSTGGFSDFALQSGAKRVVCVDVGTNQLDWKIRNDHRTEIFEKTDVRNFKYEGDFDWVVCDLSFIRSSSLLSTLSPFFNSKTFGLFLIKPQFETVSSEHDGVITDKETQLGCVRHFEISADEAGFEVLKTLPSQVLGRQGNQEYFCYVKLKQAL